MRKIRKKLFIVSVALVAIACNKAPEQFDSKGNLFEKEINQLLSEMTVEEKVSQMRIFHANKGISLDENDKLVLSDYAKEQLKTGVAGIKNPGEHYTPERSAKLNNLLQKYIIENGRLGIPALFITESYNGIDATGTTRFERPISLSASWNRELVQEVYDVMGREARMRGLHMTHSPVADIARDPRFGRMGEGFGEDTYLVSEMVVNAVKGLQGDTKGLSKTHIGAVTKHFAGYAQVQGGKNFASMEISPRTLIDEIFPPFKAAIQRANTMGIMASHADINGIASHANKWLLTDVLRDQWGFQGYTVSDANDIGRLHYFMKVAETPEAAAEQGLVAGMDIDLYADDAYALLPEMIKQKPELEALVDRSVKRVLRVKFTLGLFDTPYVDEVVAKEETRNEDAINLAQEADLESIILLKNKNNILPLSDSKKTKIALVGPVLTENAVNAFKELMADKCTFVSEKGYDLTNGVKGAPSLTSEQICKDGIKKIVKTARHADYILLFGGGDEFTSKEAFFNNAIGDRDCLNPVSYQDELIHSLKELNKPIILVLKHRRTLSINAFSEVADAILDCWELSEFGDKAIAKTIFGHSIPSAKLPVTVPRSVGQLPFHYSQKEINYKKPYLFTETTPLYPFGFGLSYSSFEYSEVKLSSDKLTNGSPIRASVQVTNTGDFEAKEVVQLYIKDLIGSVVRPMQELKGFQKITLKPGESKEVSFEISTQDISFTGADMLYDAEKGDFELRIGESSASYNSTSFSYE